MLPQSGISHVGCRQPKFELIPVHFDVSEHVDGGALALANGGKYALTVTKTGTGDFTFTLNSPGRRACILLGQPVPVGTVDARVSVVSATASAVRIVSEVGGVDTDMDLMFCIGVYRDEKQR